MDKKYLGDSFDIVKRFWAERLSVVAPLLAHPRFVPTDIKSQFEQMVGIRVLDRNEMPTGPFGLFLDPHTGVPLPRVLRQTATASHAPLAFIETEFSRLEPRYLVCFDQSHDRLPNLSRSAQRALKRADLKARNLFSFYYVSHAPFLFVASDAAVLESLRSCLVEAGRIGRGRAQSRDGGLTGAAADGRRRGDGCGDRPQKSRRFKTWAGRASRTAHCSSSPTGNSTLS